MKTQAKYPSKQFNEGFTMGESVAAAERDRLKEINKELVSALKALQRYMDNQVPGYWEDDISDEVEQAIAKNETSK